MYFTDTFNWIFPINLELTQQATWNIISNMSVLFDFFKVVAELNSVITVLSEPTVGCIKNAHGMFSAFREREKWYLEM